MIVKKRKHIINWSIQWLFFFINLCLFSTFDSKANQAINKSQSKQIIWSNAKEGKNDSIEWKSRQKENFKEGNVNIIQPIKKDFSTFSIGTYATGIWDMRPLLNGSNSCSIWNLCSELEGINFTYARTKVLKESGVFSLDLDKSFTLSWQGTNTNMKRERINYDESFFSTLALVPHVRLNKFSNNFPLGIGLGVGPVLSIGDIVVQNPYDYGPLMSRVNFEVTYPLNKKNHNSLVFSITHDCSFFGLLAPNGSPQYSHSWYSLGFRKKI